LEYISRTLPLAASSKQHKHANSEKKPLAGKSNAISNIISMRVPQREYPKDPIGNTRASVNENSSINPDLVPVRKRQRTRIDEGGQEIDESDESDEFDGNYCTLHLPLHLYTHIHYQSGSIS
jgi:hypothetical protein